MCPGFQLVWNILRRAEFRNDCFPSYPRAPSIVHSVLLGDTFWVSTNHEPLDAHVELHVYRCVSLSVKHAITWFKKNLRTDEDALELLLARRNLKGLKLC